MEKVLIVSESHRGTLYFTDFVSKNFCTDIFTSSGITEARQLLNANDFDLCLVNFSALSKEGNDFVVELSEKYSCQIILIIREEYMERVSEQVETHGIITVSKPISRALLLNVIKNSLTTQKRLRMMQEENLKLHQKLEDIKVINRAKCVLISYLGMTEEGAHKSIERQAMNMRVTRKEIAENILKMYDS